MTISIIVPTYNEEKTIRAILDQFTYMPSFIDLVIVDGGSTDGTCTIIRNWMMQFDIRNAQLLASPQKGRAAQMNHGAKHAKGELFFFLHADTRLPAHWYEKVFAVMSNKRIIGGAFLMVFEETTLGLRFIQKINQWRVRLTKNFYGDQGIFVRRSTFNDLSQFPQVPLMEDVMFSRKMKRSGKVAIIDHPKTITSARRLLRVGVLRSIVRYIYINILFYLGVSPNELHRIYER